MASYFEKRQNSYPPIGDQLDAILKQFNTMRLAGTPLNDDINDIINAWLAVKAQHPKE